MGFGLPAAIGAKIAAPNKTVIDIDGDASLSMTAMELQTASQFGVGVKVLVLNNRFQGMVLQWQGNYIPIIRLELSSQFLFIRSFLRLSILSYKNDEPRFRRTGKSHERSRYQV
jgi:hypothetical protein